ATTTSLFPYTTLFRSGEPPLQEREGDRPVVPYYVAPQRQVTDDAEASIKERMERFLRAVVRDNDGVLEMRPSCLEDPRFDAVWRSEEHTSELQSRENL